MPAAPAVEVEPRRARRAWSASRNETPVVGRRPRRRARCRRHGDARQRPVVDVVLDGRRGVARPASRRATTSAAPAREAAPRRSPASRSRGRRRAPRRVPGMSSIAAGSATHERAVPGTRREVRRAPGTRRRCRAARRCRGRTRPSSRRAPSTDDRELVGDRRCAPGVAPAARSRASSGARSRRAATSARERRRGASCRASRWPRRGPPGTAGASSASMRQRRGVARGWSRPAVRVGEVVDRDARCPSPRRAGRRRAAPGVVGAPARLDGRATSTGTAELALAGDPVVAERLDAQRHRVLGEVRVGVLVDGVRLVVAPVLEELHRGPGVVDLVEVHVVGLGERGSPRSVDGGQQDAQQRPSAGPAGRAGRRGSPASDALRSRRDGRLRDPVDPASRAPTGPRTTGHRLGPRPARRPAAVPVAAGGSRRPAPRPAHGRGAPSRAPARRPTVPRDLGRGRARSRPARAARAAPQPPARRTGTPPVDEQHAPATTNAELPAERLAQRQAR